MTSRTGYTKAKDLVTFRTGKLDSNAADPQGKYPFFTCAQETYRINTYAFDTECVLLAGNNAGGIFPLKFYKGKFNAYQRTYVIESRNTQRLNIKYFYFYLRRLLKAFEQQATGAATKFLTLKILQSIDVPTMDIVSQEKIAAVLSAHDDLIENNKRRISLLEEMVEEIYREWFVRFRFPGHERAKVVKGVPSGWEVQTLGSFSDEIRRGVKKKNLPDDERYVGLEHIPRHSIALRSWTTADTVESDKLLFKERDILFGKIRPYLHKVAIAHFSGACSSDTIVLRPKKKCYEGYLLFTVFSDTFVELATVASKGTKMPRADWGFLKKLQLIVPHEELLGRYQAQFDIVFTQIANLLHSNLLLTTSRDLLLPRLISGKLPVEHLDIQFPPGMIEELDQGSDPSYHA